MTSDKLARFWELQIKHAEFELTFEDEQESDQLAYELVKELAEENERLRAELAIEKAENERLENIKWAKYDAMGDEL